MDGPSHSGKKQGIVIFLPLLVIWIGGLWALWKNAFPIAAHTAMMTWYFSLSLILLELHFMETGVPGGPWPAALSFLCGVRAAVTGRQLPAALFSPLFLLLVFLSLKREGSRCPRRLLLPGIGLAALACIWEPARFTLSLCCLAAALHSLSRQMAKAREETLRALSEGEMLTELNRMKNQSCADLCHEMKTPLTVISLNAQLAAKNLETGDPDEDTITDIRIISSEAARLTQMVNGIAGLGQLQGSGKQCAPLSACELARTTARTCQALSGRYGNTLTVTAEPDLPPVFGNADRLTQVLINLINNANRHTRNGSIFISVRKLGDGIEVSVADNGEGIEPALLPHVFERFCCGDKGNTGLGLPICQKIIEDHGGHMGIESRAGQGTRVWFTLPTGKDGQTSSSTAKE